MVRILIALTFVVFTPAPALGGAAAVDPANYVRDVTNPWWPLPRGSQAVFRGTEDGRPTRDVVTVLQRTKTILGVRCVVVSDNLYVAGRLRERTLDWYAQDKHGTVWYFGEDTAELATAGRVTSREGSWEAGVDGAEPGIVMPGRPRVGQSFRQEYYKGRAEDHFRILGMSAHVATPFVSSDRAMETLEW